MKKSFAVSLFLAFLGAIGMNALVNAQQQTGVGQNQNVVTGSDDQFIGDMFRQRQNEGVLGTSSVNPLHQMVAYNDYRTVDMADDPGAVVPPSPMSVLHKLWNLLRAPFVLARGDRERGREAGEEGEMGDSAQAWIGLSFTDNGKDWYTGLHPGHPFDNSNLAPVLRVGPDGRGYQAASDPVMATTADKFFVGGIAFTPGPGGNSVGFVSRFVDRNDTEIGRNIQYEWTKALVVAPTGFFVDKPNIAAGPDGHVYVAFVVFDQNDPQRLSSKIYFYRSSDYGLTWSTTPVILSDPLTRNQSPWILVDPNNENTVYVGWRVFANRAGGIANAIVGRKSTNGGASFIPSTPYTVASQLKAFDMPQGTLPQSLPIPRSNAYPTAAIDGNGAIHAAIQEYVNPSNGTPLGRTTPITNGVPRITVTSSYDGGVTWTSRRAVDFAAGSGTQFMPVLTAVGEPGTSCPGNSGRPRSRVMLAYYDARAGNVGTKPGTNGFVIGGNKQFDVRIATAPACPRDSANRLVFSPSVQMSRYSLSADKPHGIQKTAGFGFTAVNRGYSMFCGGNCAFTGDYIHLAPRVPYVLTPAGWRSTTSSAVDRAKLPAPVVQGVWADARDVKLPTTPAAPVPVTDPTFIDSLPWANYQAPGLGKLPSMCQNAGARDQNIYSAEFASGELFAAAPETFRTSNIPRAYPLYVENRAGTQRLFRLRIDPAALASFEVKSFNTDPPNFNFGGRNNKISDIVIGAYSSVTGSVIVGAGVSEPVQITVEQVDGNGSVISGGAKTAVTLFTAGAAAASDTETHPPLVSQTPTITKPFAGKTPISFQQNPFTQTPFTQTPFTQTPFTQTQFTQNPFTQTPFTQTPFTQTTTIFDVTDISFLVSNGGANTAAFSTLLTIANAELLQGLRTSNSYLFQVFINRLSPVALLNGCQSADGLENVQISSIRAPFTQTPFTQTPFTQTPFTQTPFTQTPFTQTPFTQTPFTQTNNPSDPTVSNSTFYVAPPSPAEQTARLQSPDAPRVVNASLTFAELEAAMRGVDAAQAPANDFRNKRPTDLIMYSVRAFQIKASTDPTFVSLFNNDGTPQLGITVKSDAPDVIQLNGRAVFDPAGARTSSGGAAVPVRLAFATPPPASMVAGSQFGVQVAVQDGFGNLVANSSLPVTIGIGFNAGPGTLSGTLTRNAVNGIATFNDLSIDTPGNGYTLVATSGLLAPATSAPFNVISMLPDLVVESLTHSPSTPTTADTITFTAVVKNNGTGDAAASTLLFTVGGETPKAPQTLYQVPALAPGGSFSVERQLSLEAANYSNTATADFAGQIAETNESNNTTTDSYTVTDSQTVVLPGDPQWVALTPPGTASEVSATQPRSGLGSLELVTGINRNARFAHTPAAPLGTYAQLSAFSYNWYIDPESMASVPALMKLRVYGASDPRTFLIGWNPCQPACAPQQTGTWQTTNSLVNLSLFRGEFGALPNSLAEIPPDAPITGIVIDGNFASGGPWFGYVDNVTVGFGASPPAVFNFEVNSPAQRRIRPAITWANPSPGTDNTTLSAAELNATANVVGAFTYLPLSGTTLAPEFHILSTSFAPSDAAQYLPTAKIVPLMVTGTSIVAPVGSQWFPYLPEPTGFAAVTNANQRSGTGSLELGKQLGLGSAFIRERPRLPFGRLNELSALSYDWFIDPASSALRPPEIAIRIYEYGDPRSFFLFWNACPGECPIYSAGLWQTTDVLGMLSIQGADGNPPPASLEQVPPDAPITGIHLRANHANGQPWHGFADNVTIAFGDHAPVVYNFEAPAGPDLTVALSHAPAEPTTADVITFTADITNSGGGVAAPSILMFKIGAEEAGSPDTLFNVPSIPAGDTFTVQRQLQLTVAQPYQNTATADYQSQVAESNESNNTAIDDYTVDGVASAADRLAFHVQPSSATAGVSIAPPVQVAILDATGNIVTTATDAVTIAIGANPGGGGLFGTVTRNAVNGIATFNDLSIERAGNGYTLVANSGSLTPATSQPFNIQPSVLIVTTPADSGPGSLRQAILDANARPIATSTIRFNLAGDAPHTITPASPLPGIGASMIIDGTASGVCTAAAPTVVLNGASAGFAAHGLLVNSPGVTIRGIAVTGFDLSGIFLAGGGNNLVECNYLGLLPDGLTPAGNEDGVRISGSNGNQVVGNLISGNDGWGVNVQLSVANTSIRSNIIGLDVTGADAGNAGGGIRLDHARGTIIGGPGGRNIISGNGGVGPQIGVGIQVLGNVDPAPVIQSNYIGLDPTGLVARSNNNKGIVLDGLARIGGNQPQEGNYISGNGDAMGGAGIIANLAAEGSVIYGNVIGLNVNDAAVGNGYSGVTIRTGGNVTVGSALANSGNVIAGNGSYGISIIKIVAEDPDPSAANIARNWIGTNAGGTLSRGNGLAGIRVEGARHLIGGIGIGNVIAHNGNEGGVRVVGDASTTVQLRENVIRDNAGPGIDLGGDGPTPNDAGDVDIGPNLLQNYPVITSVTNGVSTTTVSVDTSSLADGGYGLEFFSAPACNPAGFPQAAQFRLPRGLGVLGDTGIQAFELQDLVPAGHYITAVALGASPDEWFVASELSPCVQVDPFIALTPNPFAVVTNTSAPLTVTLSHPANPGGTTVTLTSNDPVASVQPTVFIAEGASAGTATVTTGSAAGPAIITATAAGFDNGTANVNVSLRTMTLSALSSLVGVGRSLTGTITLGQPAPSGGLAVNLVSSNTNFVTVGPATVTIAAAATTATFTINGIAAGSSTITASAAGASNATLIITATTSSLISMGNPPVVAPGQTSGMAVSLGIDAPPGGVTIAFESSDTNVATITPSVFIPAGVRIPAANPQITGVTPGTASITASADGFAPDTKVANVTLTLTFTPATSFAVIEGRTSNITLELSSPAPAAGLTLNTSIDNPAIATVPSTVFVAAGLTSVAVPVTGVTVGNTTIRASGTGIATATASVRVNPTPPITIGDATIGKDLQVSLNGSLGLAAPAGGVVVTITSVDPSKVLLATGDNVAGSPSITLTVNAGSNSIPTFWVQALAAADSSEIRATASGYANDTSTITLQPSGFVLRTTDFTTNTFAPNRTLQVDPAVLHPTTLNYSTSQALRGGLKVSVALTSSATNVGTIAGTANFIGGESFSLTAAFNPAATGDTTISLTTPAGFTRPNNMQSLLAHVDAPNIFISSVTVGRDLQVSASISLAAAPPSPMTVTVTSSQGAIATITKDGALVGDTNLTFENVTTTTVGTIFIQGRSLGSTAVTVQAPGYNDGASKVVVDPSGFVLRTPGFTTNTFAANRTLQIDAAVLHPTSLDYSTSQSLRGGLNVSVPVTSSATNVGTIVGSATFVGGGNFFSLGAAFDPATSGDATISLTTPEGFTRPNNLQSILAHVDAPDIFISSFTVGRDLQVSASISLAAAPPKPVTVTVTSSNGAIATITENGDLVGDTSVTFENVTTTTVGTIFIQGRSLGSTAVTVQAPGYNDGAGKVVVDPSGFVFRTPDFTTNTFAANRTLQVDAAVLHPTTLNYSTSQSLRGGLKVTVPVTSSDTNIGTIVGSATFVGGGNFFSLGAAFDPATAGDATISLTTPEGFTRPNNLQSILAHVDAPNISIGSFTVGRDLQVSASISLAVAPPSPVTVTVTSNQGTIATITKDGTLVGNTSLTFENVTTTTVGTIFIQGRNLGTTTVTVQAAGYNDGTSDVTVDPSGFVLRTSDFTTNTSAANRTLQIDAAVLHPTTLNYSTSQSLRGGLNLTVPVTSSATNVGTIVGSATFVGGGNFFSLGAAFDPAAVGTTTIAVGTPGGFSTPSNLRSILATVNP